MAITLNDGGEIEMVLGSIVKGLKQGANAPSFNYVDPVARARVTLGRIEMEKDMKHFGGKYDSLRMQFAGYSERLHEAKKRAEQSEGDDEYRKALEDIQFYRIRVEEIQPQYAEYREKYNRAQHWHEKFSQQEKGMLENKSLKEKVFTGLRDFFFDEDE